MLPEIGCPSANTVRFCRIERLPIIHLACTSSTHAIFPSSKSVQIPESSGAREFLAMKCPQIDLHLNWADEQHANYALETRTMDLVELLKRLDQR